MLYLICETKGTLKNMEAWKNDEDFLSAAAETESDAVRSASQAKPRPSASAGDAVGYGEASFSPAEPKRIHREHAARTRAPFPGSRASQPPVSEPIRGGTHRKPSPPPISRVKPGMRSVPTGHASSENTTKLGPGGRAKPPSPRGVPGKAAASPVRSSSSRGRARRVYQNPQVAEEDIESKDSNGVSDDEKDSPPRRARSSHRDPPKSRQSPPRRAGGAATAGSSIPQEWQQVCHGLPPPAPTPPPAVQPPKQTGREGEEEEEEDYQQRPTARHHHRRSTRTQVPLPTTGRILRDLFRNPRYN
jgi:hypothetical protein